MVCVNRARIAGHLENARRMWLMRSNRSSCGVVLVLFLLGAAPDAFCQATTASSSQSGIRDEEMRLYAGAKPYLDDSIPALEKKVRELKGLKPASGQEHLSDLLHKRLEG
jgi:hypothetical protein